MADHKTDRPLTLAYMVNLYPPYIVGGNEMLANEVITALRERGHIVHVIAGQGKDLPDDGFTHQAIDIDLERKADIFLGGLPLTLGRLINWHLFNWRTYRGVKEVLTRIQPDLVIGWNLYMASAAPLAAARRLPMPVVAHPADKWLLYMLKEINALVQATRQPFLAGLKLMEYTVQPLLNHFAGPDYILAVSEFIRGLHTQAGYAPGQSKATHLGVPVDLFAHTVRTPPQDRPWRFIFAGQLWSGKGPQVAIEAIHLLAQRPDLPLATLDIYGGGAPAFQDHLNDLIRQWGLEERVVVRGLIPRQDLAAEFGSHDAYLFCSIWDEPFSGGLLEAMCTGLPTIATTAGGTREAIIDGENGLLVPPADAPALAAAMARLMQEPDLAPRLGRRAAEDVRAHWSFDAYIDRLENAYRTIVDGHRPGQPVELK